MKAIKKLLCLGLSALMIFTLASCTKSEEVNVYFDNNEKISYSRKFTELSKKKNSKKKWREGMVSGNGLQGVITSGSPYSDNLIFQNMHFILPNENVRYCPDTASELEGVKQSIVKGEDIVDNASYDDVYRFHPGGNLRIEQEKHGYNNYLRYTNYETAEVGVKYTDKLGDWERKTFTSQADGVTITKIEKSSEGNNINLTLSFDNLSAFANFGDTDEVNLQYKKIAADDGSYLALVAHYPDYENSELRDGGYATLTYVVVEDGIKEVVNGAVVKDEQYVADTNPQIKISNASAVYLITLSDRTDSMCAYADFASQNSFKLLDDMNSATGAVAAKYTNDNGTFDYDEALRAHTDIYTPQFDAVTISLEEGGSWLPNEKLTAQQKGKKTLVSALSQRAYYAGRYAYLCCSGYSTSRLHGLWTGEWNPGWGSKYTMDANVNLQTSSMNTGNIASSPIGYVYFILRQADDWEENAIGTHGFTDAIQAPVNTDGDSAYMTETCYPYPFRYWNAGTSWMLQPIYETLQCYGNMQIPLNDEFDLNKLKSVLSTTPDDLTDDDIKTIEAKGYLDLEKDILLPLLIKSCNYWEQLMSPDYYTDAKGGIHYEDGKTGLADDEYYCILPSYSPENNPSNYSSPSDANTAIDIAACRDNINMLLSVMKDVAPNEDTSKWEELLNKLPPYIYDETGALKEWATTAFEENNEHRHLSHLYCVWPLFETQNDEDLRQACIQAIANRESENEASHALIHRGLIAARLKDRDSFTTALDKLVKGRIYYDSLLTNHNYDRSSAYCTDFSIGYLGMINEALLYSNTGEIEILPALPTSGFEYGTITGLRARTRALVSNLTWDTRSKTAEVTIASDIDQEIQVSCGLSTQTETVQIKAGESKTVTFTLDK